MTPLLYIALAAGAAVLVVLWAVAEVGAWPR